MPFSSKSLILRFTVPKKIAKNAHNFSIGLGPPSRFSVTDSAGSLLWLPEIF